MRATIAQKAIILFIALTFFSPISAHAAEEWGGSSKENKGFFATIRDIKKRSEEYAKHPEKELYVRGQGQIHDEEIGDRTFLVYTPPSASGKSNLPLLIVLHGGFGSAHQISNYSGFEPYADKGGFIIAYLDGTKVTRGLGSRFKGWNAGGCCGQPQENNVDDLSFIKNVIDFTSQKYGVDKRQVYGTGHSNGAMMSQRVMCETDLYRSAATISGTLQLDIDQCPFGRGKRLLNIHGKEDQNLPVAGGQTEVGFNKKTDYKSQNYAAELYKKSGIKYDLDLLEGADHSPENINDALWAYENISLPHKIVQYLGLE